MGIDEDLNQWKIDREKYKKLGEYIHPFLKDIFLQNYLNVAINVRVKEDFKLYKKLVEKRNRKKYTYEEVSDKLGVRIICRFRDELPEICKIIDNNFEIKKTQNFYDEYLDIETCKTQGYKGIHKDVVLKEENPEYANFKGLIFEIQIRTACDNVWADVYHDWGYKPEKMVSVKTIRELYCLAGLLETADSCFSTMYKSLETPESKAITPENILIFIEKPFFKFFKSEYDIDYSIDNLKFLMPLFTDIKTIDQFKVEFNEFLKSKYTLISYIAKEGRGDFLKNPLISQPEVLIIFYLLDKNKYSLKRIWNEQFPESYLEDLSTRWGNPITSKLL